MDPSPCLTRYKMIDAPSPVSTESLPRMVAGSPGRAAVRTAPPILNASLARASAPAPACGEGASSSNASSI
jgi:hypothetical protein